MSKRALFTVLALAVLLTTISLFPAMTTAQGAVTVTPNREYINVRLWPAIGATVIGSLEPGDVMTATGRTIDGDWVRIDYFGSEGWVGLLVVDVSGDLNTLPLADPRTIPYNSNVIPAAGAGSPPLAIRGRLEFSGAALRAGPSTAYPILQNLPRYAEFDVTGRIATNSWLQVSWEGLVGWMFTENITLLSDGSQSLNDAPLVPPAADVGVRLSDASAREKFLVVDEIRRYMDQAEAALGVINGAWQTLSAGSFPAVCSAPPIMEDFWLNSTERNEFPDLVEAVRRLNQGVHDVDNAITWYLDACNNGQAALTGSAVAEGQAAVQRAREALDEARFRITSSYTVQVQAIHAYVNFAQDQFERIEAIWLDVRLGVIGVPPCVGIPQQPPDYALTEWEQANYPDLIPVVDRLNEGLVILRQSIQLWQNECDAYNSVPGYVMPAENGLAGYNTMLQAREVLNDVRGNYLIGAYNDPDYLVPALTATPNATIAAILHPPYTPTFTSTPTPGYQYNASATLARSALHPTCSWFGVAGEVVDQAGNARPAALVHVYGPGVDRYIISGSDLRYGAAGFEVPLRADTARVNTWVARIEDGFGNPLSPNQVIDFPDEGCEFNVALVTFTQYR